LILQFECNLFVPEDLFLVENKINFEGSFWYKIA